MRKDSAHWYLPLLVLGMRLRRRHERLSLGRLQQPTAPEQLLQLQPVLQCGMPNRSTAEQEDEHGASSGMR